MPVISIHGLASGRISSITANLEELELNLLVWLRSKGVTIASSCDGEGVCKKCSIQNDWLTCEMTVGQLLKQSPAGVIEVSYL